MEAQNAGNESPEAGQVRPGSLRISGIAGIVGGLCLTASAIMQALQPPGCIAEECVGRVHRSPGFLEGSVMVAGLLLIAGATLGFITLAHSGSRAARVVRVGAVLATITTVLSVVLLPSVLFWAGVATMVLAVLAYATTGVGMSVSRALPSWSGILLAVSALLLIVANDQNERILLVIPFAMTWMIIGSMLWNSAAASGVKRTGRVQLA